MHIKNMLIKLMQNSYDIKYMSYILDRIIKFVSRYNNIIFNIIIIKVLIISSIVIVLHMY